MTCATLMGISSCLTISLDPVALLSEQSLAKISPIRKQYRLQLMKSLALMGLSLETEGSGWQGPSQIQRRTNTILFPIVPGAQRILPSPVRCTLEHSSMPGFSLGRLQSMRGFRVFKSTPLKSNRTNTSLLKERKAMPCHLLYIALEHQLPSPSSSEPKNLFLTRGNGQHSFRPTDLVPLTPLY